MNKKSDNYQVDATDLRPVQVTHSKKSARDKFFSSVYSSFVHGGKRSDKSKNKKIAAQVEQNHSSKLFKRTASASVSPIMGDLESELINAENSAATDTVTVTTRAGFSPLFHLIKKRNHSVSPGFIVNVDDNAEISSQKTSHTVRAKIFGS